MKQSLNDLLNGDQSSEKDDVVDDQIQIADQEKCYEDLDEDIVDNTDLPYKVLQDPGQVLFNHSKKQRKHSNEVTFEEIKNQLKSKK